jgi:hypothetical protein
MNHDPVKSGAGEGACASALPKRSSDATKAVGNLISIFL